MTNPPPVGSLLIITSDGPAVMVAIEGSGVADVREVPAWSAIGVDAQSKNPVADISMTGEQPWQGAVAVKFGSEISWCPLGSPGAVVGAGMGRSPSSVEAMDVPTPWDSRLEIGAAVRDGMRLILDVDGVGSGVRVADGISSEDVGVMITGADGINADDAGSGSMGMGADGIDPEGTSSVAMEAGSVMSEGGDWDGINPIPRDWEGVAPVVTGSGMIDADGIRPVTEEITISLGCSN
jgi:hypothetical protein